MSPECASSLLPRVRALSDIGSGISHKSRHERRAPRLFFALSLHRRMEETYILHRGRILDFFLTDDGVGRTPEDGYDLPPGGPFGPTSRPLAWEAG